MPVAPVQHSLIRSPIKYLDAKTAGQRGLRKFGNAMKYLAPVLTSGTFATLFLLAPGVSTVTELLLTVAAAALPTGLASWSVSEGFKNAKLERLYVRAGNGDTIRTEKRKAEFFRVRIELITEYVSALELIKDRAAPQIQTKIVSRIEELKSRSAEYTLKELEIENALETLGVAGTLLPPRSDLDINMDQIINMLELTVPNLEAEIRLLIEFTQELEAWTPKALRSFLPDKINGLQQRKDARISELNDIKAVGAKITDHGLDPSGYEFVRVLGAGGMGVALLCYYPKEDHFVAVKILSETSDEALERFGTEARIAIKFHHENIARGYDYGEDGSAAFRPILEKFYEEVAAGRIQLEGSNTEGIRKVLGRTCFPYYTTELIRGHSLEDEIAKSGALKLKDAFNISLQILEAMEYYSHPDLNLVHRDLKPDNVMLRIDTPSARPGYIKLIDFGIAKELAMNSGLTMTGTMMGTPYYMSPEQAFGKSRQVDIKADLYAFACILCEMLTGQRLFEGEDVIQIINAKTMRAQEAQEQFETNLQLRGQNEIFQGERLDTIYPELVDLLRRLLEIDPAARPSLADTKRILEELKYKI